MYMRFLGIEYGFSKQKKVNVCVNISMFPSQNDYFSHAHMISHLNIWIVIFRLIFRLISRSRGFGLG